MGAVSTESVIESLRKRLRSESSITGLEKGERPEAAVAIIIDPKHRNGSLLLIRRTERHGDPWSGQVAFPGGYKKEIDRTFLETAIREAHEEVGVELGRHRALGALSPLYSYTRHILIAPYVFELKGNIEVQLNQEVAESFWVPLHQLSKIEVVKSEVQVAEGKLVVNSYVYDRHVVWGLTFRIINVLLNRQQVPES
jgi:8-oxo-dGTP pyrophosphatase MutT (NUDIX family)